MAGRHCPLERERGHTVYPWPLPLQVSRVCNSVSPVVDGGSQVPRPTCTRRARPRGPTAGRAPEGPRRNPATLAPWSWLPAPRTVGISVCCLSPTDLWPSVAAAQADWDPVTISEQRAEKQDRLEGERPAATKNKLRGVPEAGDGFAVGAENEDDDWSGNQVTGERVSLRPAGHGLASRPVWAPPCPITVSNGPNSSGSYFCKTQRQYHL